MKERIILFFIILTLPVYADDKNDVVKKMLSDECSTKGNCGYKPAHPDTLKGIRMAEQKLTRGMNSLPSSADLSKDMPPVMQQDGFSCAAWATTYYLRSYQEKKMRNWSYYHFDGVTPSGTQYSLLYSFIIR